MKTTALFLSLSVSLFACGGDDDDDSSATPDAPPIVIYDSAQGVDGSNPGTPDAASATCLATSSYGDLGSKAIQAQDVGDNPGEAIVGLVEADASGTPDYVSIQLYAGYGVFPSALSTGTFQLTGDETTFDTCGACVRMFVDATSDAIAEIYMAKSGSITLTSVSDNLTGTLTNVDMRRVKIDETDYTTTDDGNCTTTISNLAFDGAITTGVAGQVLLHVRKPR